jgi:hypothetical protein
MLKSLTASFTLEAFTGGSIVITLTPGLTIIFYSHKASEARSFVWTTAEFFVWTKEHDSKRAPQSQPLRAVSRNQKSILTRFMMISLHF